MGGFGSAWGLGLVGEGESGLLWLLMGLRGCYYDWIWLRAVSGRAVDLRS